MNGLRWGILGPGGIARAFTRDLRLAGLDVAAVGSRRAEVATAFAEEFGVARVHTSYDDLVADPDIDIVYIATPHPFHAEQAILALRHGKHVLVEKPFTLTGAQARAVREVARETGLLAMEAMWTRYLPHMERIRALVSDGALGDVRAVLADHTQRISSDPLHRLNNLELGGGSLLDLGIYPISFAWDILGAPTAVSAAARIGETGADVEVATIMTHAGGALSTSLSASQSAGPNVAHVVGTEARIDIDRVWYNASSFRLTRPDGTVLEDYVSQVDGRGMQYQALAAERLVAAGATDSDVLPLDETVAIMENLDEIRTIVGVDYPGQE
ncbi:Gfo/Idh/MocA family oxidoreductase [Microbacterium awajiense]|uniref:Gfo/Idh/MocA family oxidoreductase n=1 Tax=Microbacterium awajiense TaxID=415214 RepID=A0ABP7ACK5_9MICO